MAADIKIDPAALASAAPPKRTRSKTAAKTVTTSDRENALKDIGNLVQVPLIATRNYADAATVGMYWPGISREIAKLAETQPRVASLIDSINNVTPLSGLILAVVPMILQLGVNHKRVPPGIMGTVPGETLSAHMEADMLKMQVNAERERRESEREAEMLRMEYETMNAEVS